MSPDPKLEGTVLVAPLRRPVEDPVVAHQELDAAAGGRVGPVDGSVNERAVDVQINRLRRKVERDPANPLIIQTVRGIGYRLMISP